MVCCLFHVICVRFRHLRLYKELKKPKGFYPIMCKQSLYDLLEILYARKYYTGRNLIYRVLLTEKVLSRTDFIRPGRSSAGSPRPDCRRAHSSGPPRSNGPPSRPSRRTCGGPESRACC